MNMFEKKSNLWKKIVKRPKKYMNYWGSSVSRLGSHMSGNFVTNNHTDPQNYGKTFPYETGSQENTVNNSKINL